MDIKFSKALGPIKLALIDTAVKANARRIKNKRNIQCRQGCSACCSRYIRISIAEAVIMYEYLQSNNKWIEVKRRSQDQFETVQMADPLSWFKLNISCPVLSSKKSCLVYKVRPAMCSTHFVTSNPKLCDPWGAGLGIYESTDFDDLYEKFRRKITNTITGFRVLSLELAVPSALLLAERISVQSGLSLKQALSLIFRQL